MDSIVITVAIIGAVTGILGTVLGGINTYKQFFERPKLSLHVRGHLVDVVNNSPSTISVYRVYTITEVEFPLPIGRRVTRTTSTQGETIERSEPIYEASFEEDWLSEVMHLEPHKGLPVQLDRSKIEKRTESIIHDEFSSKSWLLKGIAAEHGFAEKQRGLVWATTRVVVEHSIGRERLGVGSHIYPGLLSEEVAH